MKSRFPSIELPRAELAADASITINLLGTGIAETLIKSMDRPIIMAEEAIAEVRRHPLPDADLAAEMGRLRDAGLIRVHALGNAGRAIFHQLVANDLAGGLDDGEAATIALAIEHAVGTVAVVDEKKARRIFTERWTGRIIVDTLTLLAQPQTQGSLSPEEFARACGSALRHARMRVPAEGVEWLIGIIGRQEAEDFPALARVLRGM